ncbi:hypothetical protein C364_06370 [Cryptococcus neoformans Bt63]|nr:hypothetical protein C364_06370 [Cryptococcus neoformans var. grubii Bt63]
MERITECGRTSKEQTVSKAKWRERWARWKGWRWRIQGADGEEFAVTLLYGEHGCLSLHGCHSANYCIR